MQPHEIDRCIADPSFFARVVCGSPLWKHQEQAARAVMSAAVAFFCLLAGRRAGKSRLLAILGLWVAFRKPRAQVVIVSATETAARRIMEDCAGLLSSSLLDVSVADDFRTRITLSNGSTIKSFPASARQIRGEGADLAIVDEGCFVDRDIYASALLPVVSDRIRHGAKVVVASSPWPSERGKWFRELHERGLAGDPEVASFTWPSTVNPSISRKEMRRFRASMTEEEYLREHEARWTADLGSYFAVEEIEAATADYELAEPKGNMRHFTVCAGVDYGFHPNRSALTLIAAAQDGGQNSRVVHYPTWVEWHSQLGYPAFLDRVMQACRSYGVYVLASEANGPGMAPTQELRQRAVLEERLGTHVIAVYTTQRNKMNAFGRLKMMMANGDLVLPRIPELQKELRSIEFEHTDAGTKIAAKRGHHDDIVMSLCQAVRCVRPVPNPDGWQVEGPYWAHTRTATAVTFPQQPRPREYWVSSFTHPEGSEK